MVAKKATGKRKYGAKAQDKVERAMHEMKQGKLRSGRSGKKVKSRKQAIAIGLVRGAQSWRKGAQGQVTPNRFEDETEEALSGRGSARWFWQGARRVP
jgi:hypothetical protein